MVGKKSTAGAQAPAPAEGANPFPKSPEGTPVAEQNTDPSAKYI